MSKLVRYTVNHFDDYNVDDKGIWVKAKQAIDEVVRLRHERNNIRLDHENAQRQNRMISRTLDISFRDLHRLRVRGTILGAAFLMSLTINVLFVLALRLT